MLAWFKSLSAIIGAALKTVKSKSFLKTCGNAPEKHPS